MPGYAIMIGQCCACHKPISFNPHKVPSLLINGERQPLCRGCADRWNELHPEMMREIQPDAYEDEILDGICEIIVNRINALIEKNEIEL